MTNHGAWQSPDGTPQDSPIQHSPVQDAPVAPYPQAQPTAPYSGAPYGSSPYGYGGALYGTSPYGSPPGAPPPGTNGLAIAALVLSLAGIATCGVTSILGVILGVVALSQIKQRPQDGRGMALAGVWIGGVLIALWGIYYALMIANVVTFFRTVDNEFPSHYPSSSYSGPAQPSDNADASGIDPRDPLASVPDLDLKGNIEGDCLDVTYDGSTYGVGPVACSQMHDAEVFAEVSLPPTTHVYDVSTAAHTACASRFTTFVGRDPDTVDVPMNFYAPTQEAWEGGDHRALCVVSHPAGETNMSMRGFVAPQDPDAPTTG